MNELRERKRIIFHFYNLLHNIILDAYIQEKRKLRKQLKLQSIARKQEIKSINKKRKTIRLRKRQQK